MRGATSSRMPNVPQLLPWIGLAVSLVTLAISTPKLEHARRNETRAKQTSDLLT
jgi:hypothetical protein